MIFRSWLLAAAGLVLSAVSARAETICTAFADAGTGEILKQEGACDQRVTAVSTFKIALALMGYDSGFLKDGHDPKLPFKKGYADWIKSWRTDTDPTSWIRNSVVWYSWQITQSLGDARFKRYVETFDYGNRDVSGNAGKNDGLTRSWLSSSLKISPLEQLTFLEKIVNRKLPVSTRAFVMTARITTIGKLSNGWEVHGKTGTGFPRKPNGKEDRSRSYGWFVGWATKGDRTIVFARLIQDGKREEEPAGPRAREAFLQELPQTLNAL
ncbi:MAG TPA: class D beta-lactamase [Mesorhizobium sp.]|jgi:beta-lactamase class D|uniref:class D beta-lactamase n=1 Tax=Mesorhizobium sp. TaxID=1871066 RepID=UPI002DDD37B5|nr:class D beta-lactamase [Mesorhizobium sp.]HEV2503033.1 class D beta-lactamase [Mesorhizobium sp.]